MSSPSQVSYQTSHLVSTIPSITPITTSVVIPKLPRRPILIGIILVRTLSASVVLVVHVLRGLSGVVLGALAVVLVHALCLGEFVDFGAGEAGDEFFGEGMGDGFAWGERWLLGSYWDVERMGGT